MSDATWKTDDIALKPGEIKFSIAPPMKRGAWRCEMYGMGPNGFIIRPPSDECVPNWFYRQMQRILLGHKWIKETE